MDKETFLKAQRHANEIHELDQIRSEIQDNVTNTLKWVREETNRPGQFDNLELGLHAYVEDYFKALIKNEQIEFDKI